MRTNKEIEELIKIFEHQLTIIPQYNFFNEDNHENYCVAISLLKNNLTMDDIYEEYNDNTYSFVSDIETWKGDLDFPRLYLLIDPISESIFTCENMKPKVSVCKNMCGSCPFSKTSLQGFLGGYTLNDFVTFHTSEITFPCHNLTLTDTISKDVDLAIINGKNKFCRGYVESVIKSGKLPKENELLIQAINEVKDMGLSENSMSFIKFNNYYNKK